MSGGWFERTCVVSRLSGHDSSARMSARPKSQIAANNNRRPPQPRQPGQSQKNAKQGGQRKHCRISRPCHGFAQKQHRPSCKDGGHVLRKPDQPADRDKTHQDAYQPVMPVRWAKLFNCFFTAEHDGIVATKLSARQCRLSAFPSAFPFRHGAMGRTMADPAALPSMACLPHPTTLMADRTLL